MSNSILMISLCVVLAVPLLHLRSQTRQQQQEILLNIDECIDSAVSSPSKFIPRDAKYVAVFNQGFLVVRVRSHSFARIRATFEILDMNHCLRSKWDATLKNMDHDELETSEGPNGTSLAVMTFSCNKPFPAELRVPDDDGQWLCWLNVSVVHPMISRPGPIKPSLILIRKR